MKTKNQIMKLSTLLIILVSLFITSCGKEDVIQNTTVTDADGNVYKTVTIGSQTWMAENLKVTQMLNGSEITLVATDALWAQISDTQNTDAYSVSNGTCFYTSTVANKVCPSGWRLPSESDWKSLGDFLTMNKLNANALKAKGEWFAFHGDQDTACTDNYGFSAFQTGMLENNYGGTVGNFNSYYWTSNICSDSTTKYAGIFYGSEVIAIDTINKCTGIPIRCVKD